MFSVGVGLTGHVAQTGKPMLVPNVRESDICLQLAESVGDESLASVPLRYGQRVIGVITLAKLGIGQFDEDDLRLLEVLAGHASVALENARLYGSLRREADNAKAWLEFADAVSEARSVDEIGEETVRTVARADGGRRRSRSGSRTRTRRTTAASPRPATPRIPAAADGPKIRPGRAASATLVDGRKTPFLLEAEEHAAAIFANEVARASS